MKQKPVATIIREVLIEDGIWIQGISRTYQDTAYSRKQKSKRWAAKYMKDTEREQAKALQEKIRNRLTAEGYEFDNVRVCDGWTQVTVHMSWPIQITELSQ